jgi:hypothetical protein
VLGGIVIGSYVGLAWYDELYNCDERLRVGALTPFTSWMKPAIVDGKYGGGGEN